MSRKLKLFFDVNLSRLLARELYEFYKSDFPDLEVKHLTEFTQSDAPDPDWIALLQKESDWIVISCDRGKNSKLEQKLPLICKKLKVTHILLSSGLAKKTKAEQKQAIAAVWQDIVAFASHPAGSQALLRLVQTKSDLKVCLQINS